MRMKWMPARSYTVMVTATEAGVNTPVIHASDHHGQRT